MVFLGFCSLLAMSSLASAGPCTQQSTPLTRAICENPAAETSYADLRKAYIDALDRLSREGKTILEKSEKAWEQLTAATCIDFPEKLREKLPAWQGSEIVACLTDRAADRRTFLDQQGRRIGGYVWQDLDVARDLYCLDTDELDTDDTTARDEFEFRWSWPRIDGPSSPATQRWNVTHDQSLTNFDAKINQGSACQGGGHDTRSTYPVFVQGEFVQLVDHEDWNGVAHDVYAETFRMETMLSERPLRADDFFKPGSGWEHFVAERMACSYRLTDPTSSNEEIADADTCAASSNSEPNSGDATADAAHSVADFEKYAGETDHWRIDDRTLTYSFAPYELGGYLSAMEATLTWKELRPYLRSDLPFHPDFE